MIKSQKRAVNHRTDEQLAEERASKQAKQKAVSRQRFEESFDFDFEDDDFDAPEGLARQLDKLYRNYR